MSKGLNLHTYVYVDTVPLKSLSILNQIFKTDIFVAKFGLGQNLDKILQSLLYQVMLVKI
jgi:hypothetical protein